MQVTMSELRFQDQRLSLIFGDRDVSPDSVFFTADRHSFTSETHHQDSHHLAGHEFHESLGGPTPDLNKVIVHKNNQLRRKEKGKVQKVDNSKNLMKDENLTLDSARNSFSQALKECRDRRSRSGTLLKISDSQKPSSFDVNNVVINTTHSSSPRIGIMKKPTVTTCGAGTFPSPGTPNYRHTIVGIQKGWSSERVPLHSTANWRQLNTALFPNNNRRTLPSKWEDAERWIFSPVSGVSSVRSSFQQPQRRPKSKSGPLGLAYYSLYSPAVPVYKGENGGNILSNSPFSTGLMAADGLSFRHGGKGGRNFPACMDPCMARSSSVHGCSELMSFSTLSIPQDESGDDIEGSANGVTRVISRRDMATQMSPEESFPPSPLRQSSFTPSTPSVLPIVESESVTSSRAEVRDVSVDQQVTVTTRSKGHEAWIPARSMEIEAWKRKAGEIRSSHLEGSDTTSFSKTRREEARITAWENLQKAKAEAAIRKLEMKLEKKRSSSMDKIMNKFKSAQRKAQEMRSSVSANQADEVPKSSHKSLSFHRTRQLGSLSGCFTCPAF